MSQCALDHRAACRRYPRYVLSTSTDPACERRGDVAAVGLRTCQPGQGYSPVVAPASSEAPQCRLRSLASPDSYRQWLISSKRVRVLGPDLAAWSALSNEPEPLLQVG